MELTATLGVIAEAALDGRRFGAVADVGGSTVRVDVIDLLGLESGIAQRVAHDAEGAIPVGWRSSDVKGIGTHSIAHDFRQDTSATLAGMFQFFKHQDAGAFADHEAVAVEIPGTRGALRFVVACRKRAHSREPADAHGSDAGFGAAANHDIRVAALDQPERIADRMCAGGAGCRGGGVRAFRAVADGDVAGGQVYDGGRNKERGDAPGAMFQKSLMLALDDLKSADAAADVDAHIFGFGRIHTAGRPNRWRSPPPRWRTG